MIRITVFHLTGVEAKNMKIARRIANKARGAVGQGKCVLIDFDEVVFSAAFMAEVRAVVREDKIKLVGLPISEQTKMNTTEPNDAFIPLVPTRMNP